MRAIAKKVLLIGWDAADWKIINPLVDQGLMPALNSLLNEGAMGNLATLQPVLSPMLWTSIATGKRPQKHGILGFVEPDPQTGAVRPVSSTTRKVKAIWNMLTQTGHRVHVLGWFASHPAEKVNGICVSDLFPLSGGRPLEDWPLAPGAVHPDNLHDTLSGLRVHPGEIQPAALLPFVPQAAKVNQDEDMHLAALAKVVAETCSIHNAATWVLERCEWDCLAVYYNGIDHLSHAFMPFHPPRMEHVPERLYNIYQGVVAGTYRFHDMMLERLLYLAGPDTTVLLVSDHGFHSDHMRPIAIPNAPAGPAVQHRRFGMICMKGPGIKQDERLYGATLLDITPTVLTLLGQPVGEDMDGRVLVQAFRTPPVIDRIPSWEDVPGESGMHPADLRVDPGAALTAFEQFVALGYVEPPGADRQKAAADSVCELNYNLARSYLDSRNPANAASVLENLIREYPGDPRFAQQLAHCYYLLGRRDEAKQILLRLVEASIPDAAESRPGQPDAIRQQLMRRAWTEWLMGIILYEENRFEQALERLLAAERVEPRLPNLHLQLGNTYLRMGRLDRAARSFERALEIDDECPHALLGRATVQLRSRRYDEAANSALAAVGLQHFLPLGHYCLGVALGHMGRYDRATLAFQTAVSILPGLVPAHRWLAKLYDRPEGDAGLAEQHRRLAREFSRKRRDARTARA